MTSNEDRLNSDPPRVGLATYECQLVQLQATFQHEKRQSIIVRLQSRLIELKDKKNKTDDEDQEIIASEATIQRLSAITLADDLTEVKALLSNETKGETKGESNETRPKSDSPKGELVEIDYLDWGYDWSELFPEIKGVKGVNDDSSTWIEVSNEHIPWNGPVTKEHVENR
jgi:hypothetical protein